MCGRPHYDTPVVCDKRNGENVKGADGFPSKNFLENLKVEGGD